MKLHFESDLPYQLEAIESVCALFRGQEVCRSVFIVTAQALGDGSQQSLEGKHFTESGGMGIALLASGVKQHDIKQVRSL
ncbi:hypothetical protein [Candidatus Symbiobacter mobilis]|uniref:Type III restriction protein res subunit n=1 Tax=Candidatus Symbiobacter mobilis CR TaxID=946483 RepID=U5N9Q5_9BURK|nr:hypothetical protein [Candidatus Symbiobacter mobilis]AGX88301.1 type III restriction protein res subunit [Candidatus Symbiobacter mobilis CR]